MREAERSVTWETGLQSVDVRLVHAAVVGAWIDGYAVTNPIGFQGRNVRIAIFDAFAPLVHLGALQTVAAKLDLELVAVVAEPYAVARVLDCEQVRQGGNPKTAQCRIYPTGNRSRQCDAVHTAVPAVCSRSTREKATKFSMGSQSRSLPKRRASVRHHSFESRVLDDLLDLWRFG